MQNLNYSKQIVLAMFLQDKGNLAPTAAEIEQFDQDLHDSRDAALVDIMTQMGIATDVATKSQVLLFSNLGPGGSVQEMIRSGCRYFLNTLNL